MIAEKHMTRAFSAKAERLVIRNVLKKRGYV